jgi:two-component system sensor histidine kinase/response regulator
MLNQGDKINEEIGNGLHKLQQESDYRIADSNNGNIIHLSMEKLMPLLAHAIRSISECVSITDMNDQIIYINNAFLKTYQFEEYELIGKSISIVRSPNNSAHLAEVILPATLQGGWKGELLNVKKDGSEFPVQISTSVVKDDKGEPIALIGVSADITERKQAEKALFESESRMSSITNSAQDAILMIDPEGNIAYWNPAAERIFGYTSTEAIGRNLHALIVPQRFHQAHQAAFPSFLSTGQGPAIGQTLDLQALRKDGAEIDVQLSLSAIQINEKWNAVGILRDITEQKKTEAALVKAKQEAEMANKSKSMFLANMSHEIRTPLNAIIGFSQLMNRDKKLSATQKEYNVSIIRAGEHLLALINDILELSKVEAGRVVLSPANIDLYSIVDDIQMIFKERAKSKKLQFIFEKSNDLPRYVFVDEGKLRQIFVNLIGNALKFTEEGGVAVRTRIDKMNEETIHLVVEVQDSGPGIAEHEMHKLFENFEQTSSGINKGSGTGLGLALSRELAILMGGGISVSSEVGKGSVFTFRVEIKEGNSTSVETDTVKSVIGIDQGEEIYRILVVDDKKENLKVAVTLLQIVGFHTKEAVNGEDAIEKFNEWNPNLILMDMRMPVMDGYEATRRIKATEKGQKTPIVALTASTFEDELKQIDSLGIQGYIRKPFRENELFGAIGKLLEIKYIYDDESPSLQSKYLNDDNALNEDIAKLPNRLVLKMQQALAVADLDLMIELIKTMEQDNPELTQQLMKLAMNYDYDQLQQLLNKKEK